MKKITTLLLFVFHAFLSFSQTFEMPDDFTVVEKEDYAKYETTIIEASKWLHAVPLNEQTQKRKQVSYLVVKWVNGSPTVNVELYPVIADFDSKNPGMMVLYMAGSAQYVLENNYSKDIRAKHKAALKGMIEVYKSGKGIKKDKKMEALIKADEEGRLDEWLDKNMGLPKNKPQ
ncbi:MAG: hypothetical protein K2X48_17920 [Chitinophagaceae bacterium]|nr:hypothetical protein [Chitinophagaceae bacterium]